VRPRSTSIEEGYLPPPKEEAWQTASLALLEEMKEQQATGALPTYAAINALLAPAPPARR
jgi:hypothetical protein